MDADDLKKFIYSRVSSHPKFTAVIAVSVEKYPSEFSATIWIGQEPNPEIRQVAYALEAELENLGVPCSIIVKTDRELPFGGTYKLGTTKGDVSYRYYKLDPVRDEDVVYVFSVYKGQATYRFRLSLSGTLASMLRSRNRLDEERILEVYLDTIKERLKADDLEDGATVDIVFSSRERKLFLGH
jgi:hypothetical protein